jgi:hypothetical protein
MTSDPTATVVWVDAERAVICRWHLETVRIVRIESDVPAHHRSTGHVRHSPGIPHAGGRAQDSGEAHRLEHLRGFLADVARAVPPDDHVWLLGPGQTHERLAMILSADDRERGRRRDVRSSPAGLLSDRQLTARARELAGDPPRRRRAIA